MQNAIHGFQADLDMLPSLQRLASVAKQCSRPLGAARAGKSPSSTQKVFTISDRPGGSGKSSSRGAPSGTRAAMATLAAASGGAPVAARASEQQQDQQQHDEPQRQAAQQQQRQQQAHQQPQQPQGQQAVQQRQLQQQVRTRPTQGQLVEGCLVRGPPLIDIGVNLVDRSFDKVQCVVRSSLLLVGRCFNKDREAVLERAGRAGVAACIVTGTCVRTSRMAAELCDSAAGRRHNLFFTAGVHCHNAKGCDGSTLGELRQLAGHERCVAIGECGLDFNRNFSPPDVQELWFAAQIDLAEELSKPLFLHCRDAGERFAEIYRAHRRSVPGVVHCFTGSRSELELFLGMGLHIGITGWVCDDRPERGGKELAALLPLIPADRLFIETDAPYLTPRSIAPSKSRPQRNEPALLPHVLHAVAAARCESAEQTAQLTTDNARRFFKLSGV